MKGTEMGLRTLGLATLLMITASASARAQSSEINVTGGVRSAQIHASQKDFQSAIEKVRSLETVRYRVGWVSSPGEFYVLSIACLRSGTPADFKNLLQDANPIVRVMGLICLARVLDKKEFTPIADSMMIDNAEVKLTNGCVLNQAYTVGEVAGRLAEQTFFLVPEERRWPATN